MQNSDVRVKKVQWVAFSGEIQNHIIDEGYKHSRIGWEESLKKISPFHDSPVNCQTTRCMQCLSIDISNPFPRSFFWKCALWQRFFETCSTFIATHENMHHTMNLPMNSKCFASKRLTGVFCSDKFHFSFTAEKGRGENWTLQIHP